MQADRGVKDGGFKPCPDKPNCVCSQASGAHYITPFAFTGSVTEAMARLQKILLALARTRIADAEPGYLHAESRSRLFGFVDDLEFLADSEQSIIHVRSASRVGFSDFGVNRRRVEKIRARFHLETI